MWKIDKTGKSENRVEIRSPIQTTEQKCPLCGCRMLVPQGTCHICLNCGTSTGCS